LNPLAFYLPDLPFAFLEQLFGPLAWLALPATLVGAAAAYLLLQYGVIKSRTAFILGLLLSAVVASLSLVSSPFDLESVLRFCFGLLAVSGGLGFLVAREPVHAALGFAVAILSTCGVLFIQSAFFVAAATMIVYAGATIIIFLFVLMYARQANLAQYDTQLSRPNLAALFASCLLFAIISSSLNSSPALVLSTKSDPTRPYSEAVMGVTAAPESIGILDGANRAAPRVNQFPEKTAGLGRSMFTDYLLTVELVGMVLFVATIGAIALAQKRGG